MTTLIDTVNRPPAEGVEEADVRAVNSAASRKLYQARVPIYPKLAHGTWRRIKWALLFLTLGVYYGLPWLRWARAPGEPDQAVLVDFEGRRFYFFFIEIWPQEVYYITGLLILAALGLFLVTALFGRVWCGYACPQTVWTDLYIAVERFIEGDRNQRIKLAKAKWTASKIAKKVSKHGLWLLIGLFTGGAWILYFHDAPEIARDFFIGQAAGSAYLFAGLLTFTTYILAGSMREQVCTYMCPWPRIQAAMIDADALSVTYRRDRGEPRGPHKKSESWEGRGDCIDCKQCVVVCPMGIDIRDGSQLECINCGLCIDACNEVMVKVDRPKGLIAYDTDLNIERRAAGEKPQVRLIRPRTILYAGVFALVAAVMAFGLATRATLELNVLRDRAPNFVRLSDGSVRNGYTVKVLNKSDATRDVRLTFNGPDGLSVRIVGRDEAGTAPVVRAAPDGVEAYRMFVTLPAAAIAEASVPLAITAEALDTGETTTTKAVFQTGAGS